MWSAPCSYTQLGDTEMIELIDMSGKLDTKTLAAKLNEVIEAMNAQSPSRDRGPKSEKTMTDDDARKVIYGELKGVSHNEAAVALGLSYGQVYSARKGHTFKTINKEARELAKEDKAA